MQKRISFKTRQQWEEFRNSSHWLGGSDVGTIMGLNPYKTPYRLWWEKKCAETGIISNENDLARGRFKEDAIAKMFAFKTGEKIIERSSAYEVYVNDELKPFVQVALDRELFAKRRGSRIPLEVKDTRLNITMRDLDASIGCQYDVVRSWYCQGLFQCKVADRHAFYLAIENGNKDLVYKLYEYDPVTADYIYNYCTDWWEKYIIGDAAPAVETGSDVQLAVNKSVEGKKIEITPQDIVEKAEILRALSRQAKEIKKQITELQDAIKVEMMDAETALHDNKPICTWKSYEMESIDTESLRRDHPEIVANYIKKSVQRKFLLK